MSFSLSADRIVENVPLSFVPSPVITGMMATAIAVAIKPYSIAVAPLSCCVAILGVLAALPISLPIPALTGNSAWEHLSGLVSARGQQRAAAELRFKIELTAIRTSSVSWRRSVPACA